MTNLGVEATSFLKANRHHATRYATGLVDLDRRMVWTALGPSETPPLGD